MTTVYTVDVPTKTANILSSATLVVLLKKDAAAMEVMTRKLGPTNVQPQRPIGMGMAIVKVEFKLVLLLVKEAMGSAVGPTQFAVETNGGCALLQWAIHMALEAKPNLDAASLDKINAYGDIVRCCIEAAIMANPYLHSLVPLFELLYMRGA
jgi:hypothetical protein